MGRSEPHHLRSSEVLGDREDVPARSLPMPDAEEVHAACLSALAKVSEGFPWVGPLVASAAMTPAGARTPVHVITAWGGCDFPDDPDQEKHASYSDHMLGSIAAAYPWLLALLNGSRVGLWVQPGVCMFVAPATGSTPIPISQLVPFTYLTPFAADEHDLIH